MKLRNRVTTGKINVDMTPMIDVVFQLLIFFMCTLKVIEPEGDFDISMPLGAPNPKTITEAELQPFKVRMQADASGELAVLTFNGEDLGGGVNAIRMLNSRVERSVLAIGEQQVEKQEVEIDPDYDLDYEYIIGAIGACSGKIQNGRPISFLQKIKFAPIRKPAE